MNLQFHEHTAIFGGSFDPPHLGHIEAVKDLFKTLGLVRTLILPSFGTPLKNTNTSFDDRLEMTKIAFQNIANTTVSDLEKTENLQYSYQVLERLSPQIKNLVFVIGTDQFEKLSQWAHYPELMTLCDWVVLKRKPSDTVALSDQNKPLKKAISEYVSQGWLLPTGKEFQFKIKQLATSPSKKERTLCLIETKAQPISSTLVRQKLALGDLVKVKELVAAPVLEYVERKKLYGT